MGKLLKMEEAAQYLNVSQDCLRKWDRANKLKPLKTAGGHRRYSTDVLDEFLGVKKKPKEDAPIVCATYARVSSNEQKQKGDLDRQSQRLSEYCAKKGMLVTHIIKDVGSGLNDNRSGFVKLTDLIIKQKVNKLVIEHKDRLTRFQFKFIKKMFESYGCEVIVINGMDVSDTEELAADMMSLLASFSGKSMVKEVLNVERKTKKLKIIKMEVISKEEYLKIHYGDRHDYFRLNESKLKPMKFSIGDVIHTIDYHYLEDGQGNDISQEIMFVNPNVITGKYKITGFVDGNPDDYYTITMLNEFGESGATAYVGKKVIFENYKNSNMI